MNHDEIKAMLDEGLPVLAAEIDDSLRATFEEPLMFVLAIRVGTSVRYASNAENKAALAQLFMQMHDTVRSEL